MIKILLRKLVNPDWQAAETVLIVKRGLGHVHEKSHRSSIMCSDQCQRIIRLTLCGR